ncbi:MAG: translation initiation factor IF-2 [Deltaproteobacteria bacterium]|nr:translation initiation factor IF-2 [Deltaproteobacteria bacterium]MDL1961134.1 translation initiation factor IF-2 [Deltaproteobacteria bacterium]
MAKIRVHELAKEFGIASKEMVAKIMDLGYNIKNYMSTLEDYEAHDIRRKLKDKAHAAEKKEQEAKPKTTVRLRHRKIILKKIVRPTEAEEKAVTKEDEEIKAEGEAPATGGEQLEIEPRQEITETATEVAEESLPERQPVQPEVAPKPKTAKKAKVAKPKSFVKILDRPRIEIPQQPNNRPESPTPWPKKPSHADVPPIKPLAPLVDTSEALGKKSRKKGKRVVQISELGESLKKRRITPKRREKQRHINKIFAEEIGIKPSNQKKTGISKAHGDLGQKGGVVPKLGTAPPKASKRKFAIYETIQVGELAKRMGVKAGDVITKLMGLGVMATVNQSIDYDVASIVASGFDYEVEKKSVAEDLVHMEDVQEGKPVLRPPVITIMGHVDHGKTSLLDAIRKADIASKEVGGITQHIGAYHVTLPSGQEVVFLDTPGHEAFTAMRARGAKVTDIVILLVAADDGVMAQTHEAIDHARAAGVPIIVAINKIDKPGANPERVKGELAELGLIPEDWGGNTICINISAKEKTGIKELLEMMALQAEVLELKADPKRPARGHVIEAKLDRGRGPVATLLISEGTLHIGDVLVCGIYHGRVRAMLNDKGERINSAGPSMPVEIQGLSGVPEAGNEFTVLSDDKKAREVAEYRQRKTRETELVKSSKVTLENVFEKLREEELKELNIVLKTDVQGSVEALLEALRKLSTQEIKVNFVRSGIGAITESDVLLASASDAIIIGFNVKPSPQAKTLAEQEHVDIRFYDVIYHAIEEIKSAMVGLLEPVYKEKTLGRAEVRDIFHITKVGTVAGSYVLEGLIQRNAQARLLRDNVVAYNGKIASLRRFKEDAKEVQAGYECGIGLERFNDIKTGDIIEAYIMEEEAPVLGEPLSDAGESEM